MTISSKMVQWFLRGLWMAPLMWIGMITPGLAVEVAPDISDREIVEALAELKAGQKNHGQRLDHLDKRMDRIERSLDSLRSDMEKGNKALRSDMEKSNKALRSDMEKSNKALRSEMAENNKALRSDMEKSIRSLRSEMAENNETLRLEMKRDNRDLRKDLTREIRDLRLRVHDNLTILVQLFVAVIAMISGLIGYIVWDRRTALQPVRDQQFKLQQELKELKEGLDRDLERRHPAGSLPDRLVKALQLHARGDQSLTSTLRSFSLL